LPILIITATTSDYQLSRSLSLSRFAFYVSPNHFHKHLYPSSIHYLFLPVRFTPFIPPYHIITITVGKYIHYASMWLTDRPSLCFTKRHTYPYIIWQCMDTLYWLNMLSSITLLSQLIGLLTNLHNNYSGCAIHSIKTLQYIWYTCVQNLITSLSGLFMTLCHFQSIMNKSKWMFLC